jgi:alpha-D-xyloside xylohydrolase
MMLRERMRPYIMEQMRLVHENGAPPMRPLFFDFPGDQKTYLVEDEFMFGPDLLVAPVLYQGCTSRPVYLPSGSTWTDALSGESFQGGQSITISAPLERIPLYLRDQAHLPIYADH